MCVCVCLHPTPVCLLFALAHAPDRKGPWFILQMEENFTTMFHHLLWAVFLAAVTDYFLKPLQQMIGQVCNSPDHSVIHDAGQTNLYEKNCVV